MYFKNQFYRFTRNIKQTWSVIREVTGIKKQKDQIPDFFESNCQIITDYLEIANGFNSFVSQIGPNLAADIPPTEIDSKSYLTNCNPATFQFSRISEIDILQTCDQLKSKSSSGVDFISKKLVKEIAPIIIVPLHYLINLSLETGFI